MKLLVREELRSLVMDRNEPCISIYMPTLRGKENQQNSIRFRNLCAKARTNLVANGMRGPDAQEFLQPLERMLADASVWRQCSHGLALFRSRQTLRYYLLPRTFQETVVVSDRFHLKPLLPLFTRGEFYYLLALNLAGVKLYQCTRDAIDEVDTAGRLPAGLWQTMAEYNLEESVQFHTVGTPSGGGKAWGYLHGHGVTGSDYARRKVYIQEHFREVDRGLSQILVNHTPMLLAGVKYLCSIYREVNSYRGLLDLEVNGSIELLNQRELHDLSWKAYEQHHARSRESALAKYRELSGTQRASTRLERIVPAAYHGQVATLIAPIGQEKWGRYEPSSGELTVHDRQLFGEEDLVDFAAIQTLMHGGEVFAVSPENISAAPMAAILRYA